MQKNIIIVHHTAVSRNDNSEQFDAVNNYHKSLGWGMIGYHWFLEPDGTVKQGRREVDDGAHCKEEGMNFKSIGICLAGHFDHEHPTPNQYKSLAELIEDIESRNGACALYPHNYYATYKTCPGKNFDFNKLNPMTDEQKQAIELAVYANKNAHNFGTEEMKEIAAKHAGEWRKLLTSNQ